MSRPSPALAELSVSMIVEPSFFVKLKFNFFYLFKKLFL